MTALYIDIGVIVLGAALLLTGFVMMLETVVTPRWERRRDLRRMIGR